jgi:hypothetical protein
MWFGEDNDVINRTLRNDGLDIWKKDEETEIQEKNWGVLDRFMARIESVRWLCGYLAYEILLPPGLAPAARGPLIMFISVLAL